MNDKPLLGACTAESDYLSRRTCRPVALANQGSDANPSKPDEPHPQERPAFFVAPVSRDQDSYTAAREVQL